MNRVKWRWLLPAVQLPLFLGLVWWGTPYRDTWLSWLRGTNGVGWDSVYGPQSMPMSAALGINILPTIPAMLIANSLPLRGSAAEELATVALTTAFLPIFWFLIGAGFDAPLAGQHRLLQRIPKFVAAALALLLGGLLILMLFECVFHESGLSLFAAICSGWIVAIGTTLGARFDWWWRRAPLGLGIAGAVGQGVAFYHEFVDCYPFKPLQQPDRAFYTTLAWTGVLLAPAISIAASRLCWRSANRTQSVIQILLPVLLCPLISVALFLVAHAITGNWHYLTNPPTSDFIADRDKYAEFYALILRLWLAGTLVAGAIFACRLATSRLLFGQTAFALAEYPD